MKRIQQLHENNNLNIAGGKGLNLTKLIQNGFPVPNGFIITTHAFKDILRTNDIKLNSLLEEIDFNNPRSIEHVSKKIISKIKNITIPESLQEDILLHYNTLKYPRVAIRSSATAEDLPFASFAGQQDTYLNIKGKKNIIDKIKQCYGSLWSARAIAYRHSNDIPQDKVQLAIVVQEMIPAEAAGVLFTVNPISFERNQLVIESSFGLGESLVSGKVDPDQFIVEKDTFEIVSREISEKKTMAKPTTEGIAFVDIPERQQAEPSIQDSNLQKLVALAVNIEQTFDNTPQDIEWAVVGNDVYILQSRPITSLVSITDEQDSILWTRGYADDYWNDPVSPLFFDLLGTYLEKIVDKELNLIMGYPIKDEPLLRLSRGHAYFNVNTLKQKVEYEIPPFLRTDDLLNYFPEGKGQYGKQTMRNAPFRLKARIIGQLRIMLFDPDGSITNTAEAYDNYVEDVFNPFCNYFDEELAVLGKKSSSTVQDYQKLATDLYLIMLKHYRLVRYALAVHNTGSNLACNYLLTKFIGKKKAQKYYPMLVSGLEHKTSEINEQLHYLASMIIQNEKLYKLVKNSSSEELNRVLEEANDETTKSFLNEYNSFIADYGDRGFTREPYYPRWGEEEGFKYVNDILKSLVYDKAAFLQSREAKNVKRRKKVSKRVESLIRHQKLGLLKWKLFSIVLKIARKYLVIRETQRFVLDRWITRNRRLYLKIGEIFQKEQIIENKNDIFFLTRKEIHNIAKTKFTDQEILKLRTLVKRRRNEFFKYEHTTPPKFLKGSRAFNDHVLESEDDFYKGIPASQGIITAPIKVLHSIEEIPAVAAGEILVVPKTDPGWTPVFSIIGGLITETGGILSHGAVVAREFGIPAVTNVRNACTIFESSKTATINGNDGTIKIESYHKNE